MAPAARIGSRLTVDDGAVRAIRDRGASLLAVGVAAWTDEFRAGDGLLIGDGVDDPVARGLAALDSTLLESRPRDTHVVHRDKLVVLAEA